MKLNKYILGVGLLAGALFSSCDTDNVGEIYHNETLGITFTSESQKVNLPAYDYDGFDVEIVRSKNLDQALDYPITVSLLDEDGNAETLPTEFTAPSVASFAAGEFKTLIHVKVGDIKSGNNYNIAIDIDEKDAPVDAITRKVAVVNRDYTYSKMGIGKLVSTFFTNEDGSPAEGDVEFLRADDIHWYKAIAPYEDGYDIVFKVNAKNQVLVQKQAVMSDLAGYGTTFVEGMGVLKNGVIQVVLEFTVAPGSFGQAIETFVLPVQE